MLSHHKNKEGAINLSFKYHSTDQNTRRKLLSVVDLSDNVIIIDYIYLCLHLAKFEMKKERGILLVLQELFVGDESNRLPFSLHRYHV